MYKLEDIKTIHLEVTQNCQAACPMCDRNMNGEGINPHINLDELSYKDCTNIFNASFIKQLNTMYMCGNLGDPIVARDTLEIFKYFREHNPNMWLSMNTNGGAKDEAWWKELAQVYNKKGAVIFSVDGLKDTNHIYRQNVVWSNVERNMRAFISAGGRARWDFLIFEHNQHQVDEAEALAQEWGVEKFMKKKTGRFVDAKTNKKEKHQAKDRKGKNTAELKKPQAKYQFITAEGLALPCCWTAGRMYKWWHKDPKVEQIWDFIPDKLALDARNGLDKVFATGIFEDIQNSWSKPSCAEGKLKVCAMKCGAEFDPFGEQFK
jgi:MoaA/NifB/PqqE/SkfB family radical SAM enzyme